MLRWLLFRSKGRTPMSSKKLSETPKTGKQTFKSLDEISNYKQLELSFREWVLGRILDWPTFGNSKQYFWVDTGSTRYGTRIADREESQATTFYIVSYSHSSGYPLTFPDEPICHYHPQKKILETRIIPNASDRTRWLQNFAINLFDTYVDHCKFVSVSSFDRCHNAEMIEDDDLPLTENAALYRDLSDRMARAEQGQVGQAQVRFDRSIFDRSTQEMVVGTNIRE